jgi:hypothetical protein
MGYANVGMMRINGRKRVGICMLDLDSRWGDQLLCGNDRLIVIACFYSISETIRKV